MRDLAVFLAAAAGLVLLLHELASSEGASHLWTSFIYFYSLGWLVYVYVSRLMVRSKALDLKKTSDRLWFFIVTTGLLFFCSLHGVWIWSSTAFPYKGEL